MSRSLRWPTVALATAALLAGVATAANSLPAVALVNESPSLPRGVYARVPGKTIALGAVVAIPKPAGSRAYLGSLGMPADVLLLKRVAAVGGQRVCGRNRTLEGPRWRVKARTQDRRGVRLSAWQECRVLRADEVFLLGDTPGSFDSRYFGPVSRSEITGVYREVLTW
ncbi:S26 family signal peptidase [Brevundimonas sp.]|uniref:S26 family signal peptidase n=1 Tax=Brevundimonas sp. TaxID=1871086 RepID=UPI0035689295